MSSRNFGGVTTDYLRGSISGVSYPLTIVEWCRYDAWKSTGTTRWILSDGSSSSHFIAGRNESDGSPRLTRGAGSQIHTNVLSNMTLGQWHFIVTRLDAIDDAELILDMSVNRTGSDSVNPSGIDRISFGKRDNASNDLPWDGQMALWAMWNASLSDEECTAIMNGAHPMEVQPDKLVRVYDRFGPTSGFVYDELGDDHLEIFGTSTSKEGPAKLNHFQELTGSQSAASVAPTVRKLELRWSVGDVWESVKIPINRDLAEFHMELASGSAELSELGGASASGTPSATPNAQTGDLVIGESSALLSDLALVASDAEQAFLESVIASRLAPLASGAALTVSAGSDVEIDLLPYVLDKKQGLTFGSAIAGKATTTATVNGSTLTVNSSAIGSDVVLIPVSNGHPVYPKSTNLSLTISFVSQADIFPNGYAYRRDIVVPARSGADETATDFVVFVSITDDDLRTTANGGNVELSSGFDLLFTDQNDAVLDADLEKYTPTTGEVLVWVRLPSWQLSSAYRMRLYYGKSDVETSPFSAASTWVGELGVWDAATGEDLTGSGNDLTVSGVTVGELAGDAGVYDGSSRLSRANVGIFAGLNDFTIRTLASVGDGPATSDSGIVSSGVINGRDEDQQILFRLDANGFFSGGSDLFKWSVLTDQGLVQLESADASRQSGEVFFAPRYSASLGISLWLDDGLTTPEFVSAPNGRPVIDQEAPFYIGAGAKDGEAGGVLGIIDTVRVRGSHLSQAWLGAERDHLVNRGSALGVSAELTPSASQLPVAVPIASKTTEGEAVDIDVLTPAFDPAVSGLTVSAVTTPANGTTSESAGIVTYTPTDGFLGEDSFEFTVSDGSNTSTATVRVVVSDAASPGAGSDFQPSEIAPPDAVEEWQVGNDAQLTAAINSAQVGAHIYLNGSFSQSRTIAKSGLVFRSTTALSGLVTARWTLNGDDMMLYQLDFAGNNSWPTINGDDVKIYRNLFRDNAPGGSVGVRLMRTQGARTDVACNEFTRSEGSICTFNVVGGGVDGKFRRNYAHDIDHNGTGIASALVAVGQSGFDCFDGSGNVIYSGVEVTENLFVNVNVAASFNRELLMAKSSGTKISRNAVIDCEGFINSRIGQENEFDANYIERSYGIFVFGTNHRVTNNKLLTTSRGIDVFGGNVLQENLYSTKQTTGKWEEAPARNCLFARNEMTGNTLEIGARSDSSHDLDAQNITVEAHVGDNITEGPLYDAASTTISTTSAVQARTPVKWTTANVGRSLGL